jgi:hypothetical protein
MGKFIRHEMVALYAHPSPVNSNESEVLKILVQFSSSVSDTTPIKYYHIRVFARQPPRHLTTSNSTMYDGMSDRIRDESILFISLYKGIIIHTDSRMNTPFECGGESEKDFCRRLDSAYFLSA